MLYCHKAINIDQGNTSATLKIEPSWKIMNLDEYITPQKLTQNLSKNWI